MSANVSHGGARSHETVGPDSGPGAPLADLVTLRVGLPAPEHPARGPHGEAPHAMPLSPSSALEKMDRRRNLGVTRTAVLAVVRALNELGFDADGWLASADPNPASMVVPVPVSDGLLVAAAHALGDEAIGVRLGSVVPIGGLGVLDYALCVRPTWRDALAIVTANFHLMSRRVQAELVEEGGTGTVLLTRSPLTPHSRHWIDFTFALIAQRLHQTLGERPPFVEVAFVHAAPRSLARHHEHFGPGVRFDAQQDRLAFTSDVLSRALRTAELSLAPILDEKIRALAPEPGDAYLALATTALRELLGKPEGDLEGLAKRLRTSTRTLQRELGARGTSFKALLDGVRRAHALALLRQGGRSIVDISAELGFADPRVFFRAFRRWTGTAPGAYARNPSPV